MNAATTNWINFYRAAIELEKAHNSVGLRRYSVRVTIGTKVVPSRELTAEAALATIQAAVAFAEDMELPLTIESGTERA